MTDKIDRLYKELEATDNKEEIHKLLIEIKRCERKIRNEMQKD